MQFPNPRARKHANYTWFVKVISLNRQDECDDETRCVSVEGNCV